MLFTKLDLENRRVKDLFKINSKTHMFSWDHYYECYNYTIRQILDKGLSKKYALNSLSKPVLFLIRHNFELLLKKNLMINNFDIPISHDFKEILNAFPDKTLVPDEFQLILSAQVFVNDGANLRYDLNKETGESYFPNGERIEVCPTLELFNSIASSDTFHLDQLCTPFDYTSKTKKWDLTFHMRECAGLGILRTQFDGTIEMLIEGIINDGFDIHKVYLPLMFLIRHSLELALKFNIQRIQATSSLISQKDLTWEHSLATLFNCYDDYLSKIDQSKLSPVVQEQYKGYKPVYDELYSIIHNFDSNSRIFRFPTDKSGDPYSVKLLNKDIVKILRLYYFVDPFITFTNLVLEEENALI
ncbi:hypothetical protein SAMN05421820_11144 [Pedobacter steynii]|uniref:Uncharacterized protein n=1 Tax=Pedobacter steynii TaxID=430522 RepID=A0A1H0G4Z6_9SPHI|nr:hypothetical protein [Pedobacter steynii]NQX42324.1 hypothetical protein [Pedobacter steynii]SDO01978.1 hypothetical protein SAMN05421820_11144 [Pedobacter steynii]